jgi:hypothetical protein
MPNLPAPASIWLAACRIFRGCPAARSQRACRCKIFNPNGCSSIGSASPARCTSMRADCRAGERLRVQMLVPMLPLGGSVVPAFAVVAQSLPYSADTQKLPFALPAGFSAVVAPPPSELVTPGGRCADARALLSRAAHRHQDAGRAGAPTSSCGVRTTTWASMRCRSGTAGRFRWTYWAQIPDLLVADPRLVWTEPRRAYGGRRCWLLAGRC